MLRAEGELRGIIVASVMSPWLPRWCYAPSNVTLLNRDVDGIIFPTSRRIYSYEGDYRPVMEPLLVKIDMGEITLN
jgi:hypothetical protein